MLVDGTDFRIEEPSPFLSSWYSHKFHGPGLRYEVVVAIDSRDILTVNGLFRPGVLDGYRKFPVWVDGDVGRGREGGGRQQVPRITRHIDVPNDCVMTGSVKEVAVMCRKKAVVRARHETINRRFK